MVGCAGRIRAVPHLRCHQAVSCGTIRRVARWPWGDGRRCHGGGVCEREFAVRDVAVPDLDQLMRALATAEIIAVGSELLGPARLDTNSLFVTAKLADLGVDVTAKHVVGDDRARLRACFLQALERADVVVLTGGLGPTDDDLTREVVADALALTLAEDPEITATIQRRFARRGLQMPAINRRQAMVPDGATVLDNPHGSAPGLVLSHGDKVIVLLPGPPRELEPMFTRLCESGVLGQRAGTERTYRTSIYTTQR